MRPLVVRFVAPRVVQVHEVALPDRGDGKALVRTLYSGISSGTEMLAYRGEVDPNLPLDETIGALGGTFSYPFEYGYSAVGIVDEPSGKLAEGEVVFSFQPHTSHFVASSDEVVRVDGIEPRVATLFPLVETALQISLDAGVVAERDVVVVGLGAVGILSGAMLNRSGARVLGVEPRAWRREAAVAFGVESVAPDQVSRVVEERSAGRGVPLVVELSGNPTALAASLPLLAHEGTALVCSWFGSKPVPLPLGAEFHRRRLTIKSSQVSTIPSHLQAEWDVERRRAATLELMRDLPLDHLATHTFDVRDAADAYAAIDAAEEGLIHAALSYG